MNARWRMPCLAKMSGTINVRNVADGVVFEFVLPRIAEKR